MFHQLSALDAIRTNWKVKARITRMWPSVSNDKKETLRGMNLLLLDDSDYHVHAYVYENQWKSISDKVVEGGLYIISNFFTKEALGTLKPVSSKIIINFSNSTTVERIAEDDFMIPFHKFEFTDLSDLFNIASSYATPDSPEFSVDVIGVLEGYENLKQISTQFGDRDIVKFRIADGRYSHKVTVWGQLAVTTDAQYNSIEKRPIIAIVTSTKLRTFKNSVQIATLPSSKVHLNLEHDSVNLMRERLEEEGYTPPVAEVQTQVEDVVSNVIETMTLKELSECTASEYLKRNILCKVNITNVEANDSWWYNSCNVCQEEVFKVEGKYKCFKCTKYLPFAEKRYKIMVLAEDSTEAYNFILLDRAVKRLIGKTATKMILEVMKNATKNQFPEKLKEMAEKEVTFNVLLNEDNIHMKSTMYYVTDAYDSNPSSSSMSLPVVTVTDSSNPENTIVDLDDCGDTPGSKMSATKKIKMEK